MTVLTNVSGLGELPIAPKRSLGRRPFRVAGTVFLAATVALMGNVGTAAATTARASIVRASASPADTVAELFPDNTTPRWMTEDAPDFKAWMHKLDPNAKVIIDVADESASTQLNQAQSAITEGAKVLVVIAVDSIAAAKIVTDAQAAHVPVIAYTREIYNAPVKYMTGDNPYEIGVTLGSWIIAHTKAGDRIAVIAGSPTDSFAHLEYSGYMKVLSPFFKSGARKEVGPVWTPEWDTSDAHSEMAAFLTETHNNIQAVLASNDSTAEGAVAALQSVGLAGKIPVTGIDATLASDQLIL
ncbi:MAG: substrate-binding domain-containing protein, partial [Acidimicrobiales bacterium]